MSLIIVIVFILYYIYYIDCCTSVQYGTAIFNLRIIQKIGGLRMERPYIICHMMTSLDGKIIGDFMNGEGTEYFYEQYEKILMDYGCEACMIGRISLQEMGVGEFTAKVNNTQNVPRTDYVANKDSSNYMVAVDPSGKLGWTESRITEGRESNGEHIIEILTDKVTNDYLLHLQNLGVSYIFGGKEEIDFNIVVRKLRELFSINQLLVAGGGTLNGHLLNEGFIDELSLVLMPFADGMANSKTIFETDPIIKKIKSTSFVLNSFEKLDNNGLWLTYKSKN